MNIVYQDDDKPLKGDDKQEYKECEEKTTEEDKQACREYMMND
jgi:hypothetical protein